MTDFSVGLILNLFETAVPQSYSGSFLAISTLCLIAASEVPGGYSMTSFLFLGQLRDLPHSKK